MKKLIGITLTIILILFVSIIHAEHDIAFDEFQREVMQEQEQLINFQQKQINILSAPLWGITGGVVLAEKPQYKIGIAYKVKNISYSIGLGGSEFNVWGDITIWFPPKIY